GDGNDDLVVHDSATGLTLLPGNGSGSFVRLGPVAVGPTFAVAAGHDPGSPALLQANRTDFLALVSLQGGDSNLVVLTPNAPVGRTARLGDNPTAVDVNFGNAVLGGAEIHGTIRDGLTGTGLTQIEVELDSLGPFIPAVMPFTATGADGQ